MTNSTEPDVLALDAATEILALMFPDLPFHSTQLMVKIQAIIGEAIEKGIAPWRTPFCVKCGPELRLEWRDGAPGNPWDKEWFIAETTYGDRVVLTALPKEWTYDFKTADETYIKADKIKRWMQFPDSQFIASDAMPQPATVTLDSVRAGTGEDCPFCGSSDTFVEREDFTSSYVMCNCCGARGPTGGLDDPDDETPGADAAKRLWRIRARTATLSGQISAVYGNPDVEDCARVDREWALMRGYILPTDGTSKLVVAEPAIEARIAQLTNALKSISANTCCANCREAALVARAALASYVGLAREGLSLTQAQRDPE